MPLTSTFPLQVSLLNEATEFLAHCAATHSAHSVGTGVFGDQGGGAAALVASLRRFKYRDQLIGQICAPRQP